MQFSSEKRPSQFDEYFTSVSLLILLVFLVGRVELEYCLASCQFQTDIRPMLLQMVGTKLQFLVNSKIIIKQFRYISKQCVDLSISQALFVLFVMLEEKDPQLLVLNSDVVVLAETHKHLSLPRVTSNNFFNLKQFHVVIKLNHPNHKLLYF